MPTPRTRGPCLYPDTPRCGTYSGYSGTAGGCRGDDCADANRRYKARVHVDVPDLFSAAFITQRDWIDGAACRGADPALFFPEASGDVTAAKAICSRCLVRVECLDYALDTREIHGVWGGTTPRERRVLRRRDVA